MRRSVYIYTMEIEHLAIWVNDIELVKEFYVKYFGMRCNDKYVNPKKQFESYFLSFDERGARVEIMRRPDITPGNSPHSTMMGLTHFAISAGTKEKVDELTETLRADGYTVAGEPRLTGDGYYESVVLDPEGNYVEITV